MRITRPPHRRHDEYTHVFHPKVDCDKEQNCQRAGSPDCQRCIHNRNHKTDYFQPSVPAIYHPYWYWWYYPWDYPYRREDYVIYGNDGWGTAVTYTSSGGGAETSSGGGTETSMTPKEAIEDLYMPKEVTE